MGYGRMNAPVSILCDFDGTISIRDMVAAVSLEFAPQGSRALIESIQRQDMTVRDGVTQMFRLIPADKYPDMVRYARERTVLRPGVFALIDYAMKNSWKFSVVSGGFDFFVRPALMPVASFIDIYCNRVRARDGFLDVVWPYGCDDECNGGCGLCKPAILRKNRAAGYKVVVIGDGITDLKSARLADYVFARGILADRLKDEGISHTTFETFHDIIREWSSSEAEVHQYVG